MRRFVAAWFVIAVIVASQLVSPLSANAHGVVAPPPDANVTVSGERAVVNWDGSNESIVMMLNMKSEANRSGLIVPTPSPATVSAGTRSLFAELERITKPVGYVAEDWFGTSLLGSAAPSTGSPVLQQVHLGPIEATTLAASNVDGLRIWLADNNFVITDTVTEALEHYSEIGWSFVAIRLAGDESLDGQVDPIALTFPTTRLIYPISLSYLGGHPRDLFLYVFDKQRDTVVELARPSESVDAKVTVVWAGNVIDEKLRLHGNYLTVMDIHFDDPGKQISDDIAIVASPVQDNVQPTVTTYRLVTLLGVPVGSLVLGWAILGAALITGLGVWRRRAS